MRKYKQITYKEMVQIETYLEEGWKVAEIALKMGRDKTTVYRCIEKNKNEKGKFEAEKAWEKVKERQMKGKSHPRILEGSLLEQFVLEKIEHYWSPEQIANVWKNKKLEAICHETIYQYVYKNKPDLIKVYFRRKGKKYQHKRKEKYQIPDRRMIDGRPQVVEERKRFGDWEGDTIIGKNHKQAILTNVERKSGYILAEKMKTKDAKLVADITKKLFKEIPEELRLTITYDNGREFAWHKIIEVENKMTVYFAHPYASWQRGTNENTNGLLRQFIPKGTDFNSVTDEDLKHYIDLLNNRPRKRLNFKTPLEVFSDQVAKVALTDRI